MTAWTWQYHPVDGGDMTPDRVSAPEGGFPSQAEAESWVGESWPELLECGVDSVSLLHEGRIVYGPMSLRPLE